MKYANGFPRFSSEEEVEEEEPQDDVSVAAQEVPKEEIAPGAEQQEEEQAEPAAPPKGCVFGKANEFGNIGESSREVRRPSIAESVTPQSQ